MNIAANFRAIGQFRGREARRDFWPYAGVTLIIYVIAGQIVAIPFMNQMLSGMLKVMTDPKFVEAAQGANPFAVQAMMYRAMPDMTGLILAQAAVQLLWYSLLAAATVRRLRDGGVSPYWALLPVPFKTVGLIITPAVFAAFRSDGFPSGGLFSLMMLNSTLVLAAWVTLIVLLCRSSTVED
jgi:uncharacterized membrane protein YhaH (DUF805 family)